MIEKTAFTIAPDEASSDLHASKIITSELLFGEVDDELVLSEKFNVRFHQSVISPLYEIACAAETAGFTLKIASSYRSFERQLLIWNDKASGVRPVLDAAGCPINILELSDTQKVFAILRWSALPGASRHHWGTDFDVYDSSRITPDYMLQLSVEETEGCGPFAQFHQWLTSELDNNPRGFFRPYRPGVGGIAPEPWHLSYAPVANQYARQLTQDMLFAKIQATDIALKEIVLENLEHIFQLYVKPYCF